MNIVQRSAHIEKRIVASLDHQEVIPFNVHDDLLLLVARGLPRLDLLSRARQHPATEQTSLVSLFLVEHDLRVAEAVQADIEEEPTAFLLRIAR